MKFSLSLLVAVAAAALPTLITARAIPNDAVVNGEGFANLEAEALSNFEVTRRGIETGINGAQEKRNINAETVANIADLSSSQLAPPDPKKEKEKWEKIHTEYKDHSDKYADTKRRWNAEKNVEKKKALHKDIIHHLTEEVKGREQAQKLLHGAGFNPTSIAGHQKELDAKKKCLQRYKNMDNGGC